MVSLRSLRDAYEQLSHNNAATGKLRLNPPTGVETVAREEVGPWHIEVTCRRLGVTVRRDQFNVTLRRTAPEREAALSGFATKEAALAAARRRVTDLDNAAHSRPKRPHYRKPLPRVADEA